MKQLKKIFISLIIIYSPISHGTTLEDSLRSAYKYNPKYLETVANTEMQKQQVLSGFAKFMPNISYARQKSITRDRNRSTQDNPVRSASVSTENNTLSYQQNLFNGGEDFANLMSSKTLVTAQEQESLSQEQQIFLKVIQSHLNVIGKNKIVNEYQKNINYLTKTLNAEQQKFEAGLTKRTDLANTKANLERGKAYLTQAISEYEVELANYKSLTGIDAVDLEEPSVNTLVQDDIEQIYLKATKSNPNLKSNKNRYDAAEILSKAAFSVFMPSVSIQGTLSRTNNMNGNIYTTPFSKTKTATANISVPIFQGGAEYAQYKSTKIKASIARLRYIDALAGTEANVKSAWYSLSASKVSLRAYEEAVEASRIALDGMTQAYEEGLVSLTDLLKTLQDDVDINITMINSKTNVVVSFYNLKSTTGELTAKSLGIIENEEKTENTN
jgi:outer membrane protein